MHDLFDCNLGLLIGYDCSQALTPREVLAGGNNEPYGIKMDLGWSIIGGRDVRSGCSLCHKVAVREIPAVTLIDIVRVLESDFQGAKNDKKTSQEDLNFVKIMEEGIDKTGNRHYEMPLPTLPDSHLMAMIRLEHLKRKFLKDTKYNKVRSRWERWKRDLLRLNDPKSLEPLTPNHLLTMKNKTLLPPPGNLFMETSMNQEGIVPAVKVKLGS